MSSKVYHAVPKVKGAVDKHGYPPMVPFGGFSVERAKAVMAGLDPEFKYELVAFVRSEDPEKVFELSNSIEGPWLKNAAVSPFPSHRAGARSSSVGDLFMVNGKPLMVASFGFNPLH
jgi:hypothetical protein